MKTKHRKGAYFVLPKVTIAKIVAAARTDKVPQWEALARLVDRAAPAGKAYNQS